jgi:hypothetical protein
MVCPTVGLAGIAASSKRGLAKKVDRAVDRRTGGPPSREL